jgi:hypothetical protein
MEQEERLSAREVEAMARQYSAGKDWNDANRGWSSDGGMRNRYPMLKAMETMLRITGWLAVAGGVAILLFNVFPWLICVFDARSGRTVACAAAISALAPMIGALAIGFALIAFGEVIGVFRGIEGNTYQMLSRIEQIGLQSKLSGEGGRG